MVTAGKSRGLLRHPSQLRRASADIFDHGISPDELRANEMNSGEDGQS